MTDYDTYALTVKEAFIFYCCGYAGFFLLGYIFYRNIFLSAALGFFIIFFRNTYISYLIERRKKRLLGCFKDLLYCLSSSFATGEGMSESLKDGYLHLRNIYGANEDMVRELKIITDGIYENRENEAKLLNDFARRSHLEDVYDFTDVYNHVRMTGGDINGIITKTSGIIMEKINIDREIEVMVSQKKMEAGIIAIMPILIIGGMNITSSSYLQPLYETILGRIIMTASIIGIGVSYLMILKITDIKV